MDGPRMRVDRDLEPVAFETGLTELAIVVTDLRDETKTRERRD